MGFGVRAEKVASGDIESRFSVNHDRWTEICMIQNRKGERSEMGCRGGGLHSELQGDAIVLLARVLKTVSTIEKVAQ